MRKRRKNILRRKTKFFSKSKGFYLSILGSITIGLLFYFFFFSSTFQIDKIKIEGNKKVSTEEIEKIVENNIEKDILSLKTKSIFLFNLKETEKMILSSSFNIDSVAFEKNLPKEIKIIIREREMVSLFENNNYFFLLDRKGIVFEKIENKEDSFLIKNSSFNEEAVLGKGVIEEKTLSKILELKEGMEDLNLEISEAFLETQKRVDIKTREGWEVYFSLEKELKWQLTETKILLEKEINLQRRENLQYIDLRFEKAYYK